jgi:hypothetical protein
MNMMSMMSIRAITSSRIENDKNKKKVRNNNQDRPGTVALEGHIQVKLVDRWS